MGPEALAAVQGGAERTAGSRRPLERREVSSLAGLEFRDRRDCMTPKVRFLDGVVCVLLSRGALSLPVACSAPTASNLPDLQKRRDRSDEGGD